MELKATDNVLKFDDLRPNQHKALGELESLGANSVIVCYHRKANFVTVTHYSDLTDEGIEPLD